ncbi:DUF6126 family protein [Streptomyces sp. NPDC006624]|uniref:DUF6126 family protein n=1 Tax=Streptomyces sp. NPDC006624 TaxID=3154892 RepID=UPI0033ABC395
MTDGRRPPVPGAARREEDVDKGKDAETRKERGVALRVFFYIFGTHLFAGFVMLLFYLGQHAQK